MAHGEAGWTEALRVREAHRQLERQVAEISAGRQFQNVLGRAMAEPAERGTSGGAYIPEALNKPPRFAPYTKPERTASAAAASSQPEISAGAHDVFGGTWSLGRI